MSNSTGCPSPFIDGDQFPATGGYIDGRFCSDALGPSCCLPCPATEWFYPDNFSTITKSVDWINVVGIMCSVFLIISFVFLPVDKTHRHYLSVCLAIATIMMQLGFIIPLGAHPDQCFNEITPNDMHSSTTCALSGAFLLSGGWCGVMWVFLRSLALHLQICWQVVIGKTFMWAALTTGWGIPAITVTLSLVFSGVSFRFGDTCHINHRNSLADFWIPLLVFAGATVIIQFATFGYCIKVYLASLSDNSSTTNSSGPLPSYTNSLRTFTPRQAYRRVRRVIELQWRGIAIVLLIIADVVFFAVVFVFMDHSETSILKNPEKAQDWVACLITSQEDKSKCVKDASSIVVNEATVTVVLLLLSLNGFWALIFLGRFSMFTAWFSMLRTHLHRKHEFVSADAANTTDPRSYEMLSKERDLGKSPAPTTLSPALSPPLSKSGRSTPDYFGREVRYTSPSMSYSSPKAAREWEGSWDPRNTYALPVMMMEEGKGGDWERRGGGIS